MHHLHLPGSKETVRGQGGDKEETRRRNGEDRERIGHGGGSGDTVVVQANASGAKPAAGRNSQVSSRWWAIGHLNIYRMCPLSPNFSQKCPPQKARNRDRAEFATKVRKSSIKIWGTFDSKSYFRGGTFDSESTPKLFMGAHLRV